MHIQLKRKEEPVHAKNITVHVGTNRYCLTESVDGKLNVVKYSEADDNNDDLLKIFPRSGNEIELF